MNITYYDNPLKYQFLKWPDFDVPENPDDVLMFLQEVSNQYEESFVHLVSVT